MTDLIDAERAVIGSILMSSIALDEAAEILTGADFHQPKHELIFDAALRLARDSRPVDAVTVADALGADITRAGGIAYLFETVATVVTPASVGWHALIVRDGSTRRQVKAIGASIADLPDSDDPLEVVEAARSALATLTGHGDDTQSHEEAIEAAIVALETTSGTATAWSELNAAVGGWKPGCLYYVGARPSVGKSVFGVGAVIDMARRGQHSVLFSLEMSKVELYHRMLAATGSINMENIQHRRLTDSDWQKVTRAQADLSKLPMTVDERNPLRVVEMRSKIRNVMRKAPVGLVVIDYMQLIQPPSSAPRNDRRVQVDEISKSLKALAKELQIPIVCLAQLNRGVEARAEKTPGLADLRESGGLEQDADVVLLLHRELNPMDGDSSTLRVIVAKNRHGPLAQFALDFEGRYSRATDQRSHFEQRNAS